MAQVLIKKPELTNLEYFILSRLRNYSKPVKTRFLSRRLGEEKLTLTKALKRLEELGEVAYITSRDKKNDLVYGWIISKCENRNLRNAF